MSVGFPKCWHSSATCSPLPFLSHNSIRPFPFPLSSFSSSSSTQPSIFPSFCNSFISIMDEDNRVEEEDMEALAGLSNAPHAPRKVHSYSHQLRSTSGPKRYHNMRKHSFEESRIPQNINQYYDSDDDDFFPYSTTNNSIRCSENYRHDKSPDGGGDGEDPWQPTLQEFIASGGGNGIFRVPARASVHPSRPPCLELRPHPLRETQVGKFLRNIACTETQLWAGQESGVRVWNLVNSYDPGCGIGGRVRRGDEEAAPFHESGNTSPTTCLVVDHGNKLVWSGHKDGKIRAWKMDQQLDDSPVKEGLSWQAHRGPVLAMVMTSYGDMWSGAEGGVIKVWPWETIEKSLSLSPEEKHMAALLVERSFIDLRSQVTVNGVCSISSSDVKCLLADSVQSKVWCASPISFSLWGARTRELLKVFNVDGQTENRVDISSAQQDQPVEEEVKVKSNSSSKKKKVPTATLR